MSDGPLEFGSADEQDEVERMIGSPGRAHLAVPRAVAAASLAAALAACQSSELSPPVPAAHGWRVVERTGEARVLHPGGVGWVPVMTGGEISGASRVATGGGGRLILARAGVQIVAGTASSLALAGPGEQPVRQDSGQVRYRVERAASTPFVVETPLMHIQTREAVFDVAIGGDGGEVTVETGRLLVATSDGARGATVEAGQMAYARSTDGQHLMVRRGPDLAAVPAEAYVVSVAPRRATAAVQAVARAALEPAIVRAAAPRSAAPPTGAMAEQAILPAGYPEDREPADVPVAPPAPPFGAKSSKPAHGEAGIETPVPPPAKPVADTAPVPPPAAAVVADEREQGFAGLTAGLLDALAAARRSF